MLPTVLLGIMSLSNFGAANTIFSDFYPKVETVQVTQIPKKSFNFNLSGDEVTKLVNLDQEYPALQTINFNLNSDKGMWVKANLTGDFPTASLKYLHDVIDCVMSSENGFKFLELVDSCSLC